MSLFTELKRRNVFRVAGAYLIVAWLLIEVADTIFPRLGLPDWTVTLVIALLGLGFPVALLLSWAYEMTPDGIERAAPADSTEAAAPRAAPRIGSRSRRLPMIALAAAGLAAAWLTFMVTDSPRPESSQAGSRSANGLGRTGSFATAAPIRLAIESPAGATLRLSGDLSGPAVVSRDGTRVVFAASTESGARRLWLRDLSEAHPRVLNGTEGANFPFWSPDGRYVGYFTATELRAYDTRSDTVLTVCESPQGRGGAWTEDGRIIFAPGLRGGLAIVDAGGGDPVPLTTLDEELHTSHRWPFMIPGSDSFLFVAVSIRAGEAANDAIYLADLAGKRPPQRLQPSGFGGAFAAGHLLFVRDTALLARPFDPESGQLTGESTLITRDVASDQGTWHGQFSVSDTSVLVYAALPKRAEDQNRSERFNYSGNMEGDRITSFDYQGRVTTAYAEDTPLRQIRLSPDGTVIAYETVGNDGFTDIWLHPTAYTSDLTTGSDDPGRIRDAVLDPKPRRLTSLPGDELLPTWSPDGTEIAFYWDGDGRRPGGIYRKRIDDGTETLVRDNQGGVAFPLDWTPDGKYLIVTSRTVLDNESYDIWALPIEGGALIALVTDPGDDFYPQVSPDGRWLVYVRAGADDEMGEVAVIPFAPAWPEHQRARRWVVSQGIAAEPRWSPEGDELFYVDFDARLTSVDVQRTGDSIAFSAPRILFQTPWVFGRNYEVFPEGVGRDNHFLFVDATAEYQTRISVVLNWQALLKEAQ